MSTKDITYKLDLGDWSITNGVVGVVVKRILKLKDEEIEYINNNAQILVNGKPASFDTAMRVNDVLTIHYLENSEPEVVPTAPSATTPLVAKQVAEPVIMNQQKTSSLRPIDQDVPIPVEDLFTEEEYEKTKPQPQVVPVTPQVVNEPVAEPAIPQETSEVVVDDKTPVQPVDNRQQAAVVSEPVKEKKGFNKKLLLIPLFLLLLGGGGYYLYTNRLAQQAKYEQERQELLKSMDLTFNPNYSVEYGEPLSIDSLVNNNNNNIKVSLANSFDSKTIGKQKVTLVASAQDSRGNDFSTEVSTYVYVRDTQFPVVEFEDDEIVFTRREEADVESNIKDVNDPVDGALTKSEELQKGTYTVEVDGDPTIVGTHDVIVTAMDMSGKITKKHFDLTIVNTDADKQARQAIVAARKNSPEETAEPTNTETNTSTNTNTNNMSPVSFILMRKASVDVDQGSTYDPKTNISYVRDENKKNLPYSTKEENDSYTIVNSVDTSKPGSYTVRIIATNSEGLKDIGEYKVVVKAKQANPEETPTATPIANTTGEKDNVNPHILMRVGEIRVSVGANYDMKANLVHVTDNIDGNLPYSNKEENGSYTITSNVDFNKPGTYTVRIVATDSSGNKDIGEYKITVTEQTTTNGGTQLTLGGNAGIIYNYLTQNLGLNKAAAYGVLANISRESSYNPYADNGQGYYGICQWGGGRLENLNNWCWENGYDPSTLDGQLAFMSNELNGAYSNVLNQLRNMEDSSQGAYTAGYTFCTQYEGDSYYADAAGKAASNFYNQ